MAQSDNLFTLDVVDTGLTASNQAVQALRVASSDVADQRLSEGLVSFGAAIGQVAARKRAVQVKEDLRTARNAALRNEAMPGGLTEGATKAFNDTSDILTASKTAKLATQYFEGDEFAAILNNPEASSEQKNKHIQETVSDFLLRGSSSMQNPTALLGLKDKLDEMSVDATKSVFDIEKVQIDMVGIQAMRSQIDERIAAGLPMTGEYIGNLAASFRKGSPWRKADDTKLAAFSLVLDAPGTTPSKVLNIMKDEFSKGKGGARGVTFGALASAKANPTGKALFTMVEAYNSKVRVERERERRDELLAQTKVDTDAGDNAEKLYDSLPPDDPNRIGAVITSMTGAGASRTSINTMVNTLQASEADLQQGVLSEDHISGEEQVADGDLVTRTAIREFGAAHNLNRESISTLLALAGDEQQQIRGHMQTLRASVSTLNDQVTTGISQAMTKSGGTGLSVLASPGFQLLSKEQKKARILQTGNIMPDFSDKIDALLDLQDVRDQLSKEVSAEAKLAAKEDREPNPTNIQAKFSDRIRRLIESLEGKAPSTASSTSGTDTREVAPTNIANPDALKAPSKEGKEEILKAAIGTTEHHKSLFDSLVDGLTNSLTTHKEAAKTFEPKTFRQRTEEGALDQKVSTDETPNVQTSEVDLGNSSVLSITDRAQLLRSNPDAAARLNSRDLKDEIKATGKINDVEYAIASDLQQVPKHMEQSEANMWSHFTGVYNIKKIDAVPKDSAANFKARDKEILSNLKQEEGFSLSTYEDTSSKKLKTIGYGFNLEKSGAKERIEKLGYSYSEVLSGSKDISKEHADLLFEEDVAVATKEAESFVSNFQSLPTYKQSVIIEMAFQLGLSGLNNFSSFRAAIIANDFNKAAKEILTTTTKEGKVKSSQFAIQVPERAKRLAKRMEK